MPIFQYRFGHGLQKLKLLIAERAGRHGLPGDRRDGVAAARRVLRGALAREVGDRARRRAAGPRHPRARHAVLRARAGSSASSRTPPRASTRSRSRTAPAMALEMADGSLASLGVTLGSAAEVTRHRFSFSGLVAESNTRPYTNSGDPWTFVGDTPELDRADRRRAGRVQPAARALRRPVLPLLRRPARRHRAPRHPGRRARVARADHRHVLLAPRPARASPCPLAPTTRATQLAAETITKFPPSIRTGRGDATSDQSANRPSVWSSALPNR